MPYERDSDIRVRDANDQWKSTLGTEDGALYTSEWMQRQIIKGNGYGANMGSLSAPETLQAAVITTLRPSFWIRVPSGTTIIPFSVFVTVEDTAAVSNLEIALGSSSIDIGNGTSSAATLGPVNLNTGQGNGSLCVARQDASGDTTAAGDPTLNWWRVVKNEDNVTTPATAGELQFEWAPGIGRLPVIQGPGTLHLSIGAIAGAAAVIAYAGAQWLEFTGSDLPLL